ncbi:MAG: hypothetical protein IKG27_00855 [Bacilli bacterium]|nr:hypothetical protein [Bacilli bacterium]
MDDVEVLELETEKNVEEPKTKKGNNVIIIAVILIVALIGGFFFFAKSKTDKTLEKKLDTASREYFTKYMSANDSTSIYVVTLDMLKSANNQGEKYDLKGLEKCQGQKTLARVTIDYNNGEPKKVEVELNC